MITYLHLYQKLTFIRMSTPQCHEINVMTFDAECHGICFVGRKTNVMTLMSWDLENVMRFIFSGTGPWCSTIDIWKKSDLSRKKNRTTGLTGHVRKIWDQPQPSLALHTSHFEFSSNYCSPFCSASTLCLNFPCRQKYYTSVILAVLYNTTVETVKFFW